MVINNSKAEPVVGVPNKNPVVEALLDVVAVAWPNKPLEVDFWPKRPVDEALTVEAADAAVAAGCSVASPEKGRNLENSKIVFERN